MQKWIKNEVFRAKNEGFRHFLEFGVSGGLDVVHYYSTECFSTFVNGNVSCIINKLCIISMIYVKKSQKWPKNDAVGTFSEFGWLYWFDIANYDRS